MDEKAADPPASPPSGQASADYVEFGRPLADRQSERVLSSAFTFAVIYILPPIFLLAVPLVAFILLTTPAHKDPAAWVFLSVWSVLPLWESLRARRYCKRVILTPRGLRISNYRKEIFVPFKDIESVDRSRWSWHTIHIRLLEDTPFGRKISFLINWKDRNDFRWGGERLVWKLRELTWNMANEEAAAH